MTRDLLIDPKTRGENDIQHVVTAAASSSSKKSAEDFVATCVTPAQDSEVECKAYGSYEELVKDTNVGRLTLSNGSQRLTLFRYRICWHTS